MGKEDIDISKVANWNVAQYYTAMIMRLIEDTVEFRKIVDFGTTDIINEFMIDDQTKDSARLKALRRLIATYYELSNKSLCALKKNLKPAMEEYRLKLGRLKKMTPMLEMKVWREKRQKTRINEEAFEKVLQYLDEISLDILDMLYKSDLIFKSSDEIDPIKWKKILKERLTTQA